MINMIRKSESQLHKWPNRWLLQFLCLLTFAGTAFGSTPWRFIAVGDTRGSSSTAPVNDQILSELANEIVSHQASFVIVPGDLVYSGSAANFQAWKLRMAPVYNAGIAVYPVMGNHDANVVGDFINEFGADIPDNGPAGEVNRTYAVEHDNVLVLALDTYVNVGRVNQAWVDQQLAANTRAHVFAFGHMPAFKANHTDCLDDYAIERNSFWSSLKNGGATVYFCGHDHFYDHARIDDGDGDVDNDVHQMIVGGGGAPLYTAYKYDGANSPWTPVNVYHENQYGYTVVEVDGNTVTIVYYHRVGANAYIPSNDVWNYTIGAPPAAPTGLAATPGWARVALNWSASSGATSYNVKRSASGSGPYTTISYGVTGTAYTDTPVANGATYYYVVSAVNAAGEGVDSAPASAATPVLVAPSGLTAAGEAGNVTLNWTASSGAATYNVKRSTVSGGPYAVIAGGAAGTSYTDTGVVGGTTYYYVVSAVNAGGESGNSQQVSAAPTIAPPGAFTLTAKTGSKPRQIRLTWTASSGAASYVVKRATMSGGPFAVVTTITTRAYIDTVPARGTYYYIVTATNAGGSRDSEQASARSK